MYTLINGKEIASLIRQEIAKEVDQIKQEGKKIPHLAAILVGNDPSSQTYVANKVKDCAEVGFRSTLITYDSATTEDILLQKIDELNSNDDIDGFIVQIPLPGHISENKIIESVNPSKDVDGFHPKNVGKMVVGEKAFLPCTPNGVIQLLKRSGVDTCGKHVVVVGRSNIVGKPVANMLIQKQEGANATARRNKAAAW